MPDMASRRRKKLLIDFAEGEVLTLWYKPSRLTPDVLSNLAEKAAAIEANTSAATPATPSPEAVSEAKDDTFAAKVNDLIAYSERLRETIVDTVDSWDLTDGGVLVPLTVEGMKGIDLPLLSTIVRAMREDQSVPPAKGAG